MRLIDWRSVNHLSREALAERIGVSAEAVRLWETGERRPRDRAMSAIVRETHGQVTPNDFFTDVAAE